LNKTTTLEIIQNLRQEGLDLVNLSESEIIRIEKTLKARIKLDQSIDINEVEAIVHLLRTQSKSLELFFHDDFIPVRNLLQNKEFVFFNTYLLDRASRNGEQLKVFLGTFFFDELTGYARLCFEVDHYRALFEFLNLRLILDEEITDNIRKQMERRFMLLSETFRLHANDKPEKVLPLFNPYFYRCINQLNRDAIFEVRIMNLLSLILNKQKALSKVDLIRIIFSLTFYVPVEEGNKKVWEQNRSYSSHHGAKEIKGKYDEANFKGGTRVKGNTIKKEYSSRSIFALIIPFLLVIGFIYKMTISGSRSGGQHFDQRFTPAEIKKDYVNQVREAKQNWEEKNAKDVREAKELNHNYRTATLLTGYLPNAATIQHIQFEKPTIAEIIYLENKVNYSFSNSPQVTQNGEGFLELINVTSNHIILIMEDQNKDSSFLLMRPLQMIEVAFELTKLNVYTGEGLEKVIYLDENKADKNGLRFTTFNKTHKKALEKTFTFTNITAGKYHSVQIFTDVQSETGIGVRHKVDNSYDD